tara:strand:- start:5032 stop:6834 length:1803 start_codon:yes stop_codon:yes gene_type:complete
MEVSEDIKSVLYNLSTDPGVYQFYDAKNALLYVGKAKNLKRRVSSYFNRKHDSFKTAYMVRKIHSIKTLVVDTEMDAFLLENNLIKKYQPRYNILLKDDKTYPWICIKKEPFPRVFYTRQFIKDGSEYFGPYTNPKIINAMLNFIRQIYPLRTCNYNLSEQNIQAGKFKECLEFHIGNCLAPCIGKQDEQYYEQDLEQIRQILKGNIRSVVKHFKAEMFKLSKNMDYEKAQILKEKVELLEHYQSKSSIVNPNINDVDVFSIVSDQDYAYINFFKVSSGAIIQAHAMEIQKKLDETDEELLSIAITEIRQRFNSTSKEAFLNINIKSRWQNLKISVPKIGDKYKLVNLCFKNAKNIQKDRIRKNEELRHRLDNKRVLEQLQHDLKLSSKPSHIECFDNSNIQGTNPVSACVVFKNAKPSKKDYRLFNIKTVSGPNDFASMEEVVYRRYAGLMNEGHDLPQLIVIDGGKGQLSSTMKSLEKLNLHNTIAVIGIAKRLEEIYFPNDSIPLFLDKRSESLKVIQKLRNEAHRFSINHHRNRRSKNSLGTSLDYIVGIGPKTVETLISHYGSVKRVLQAQEDELTKLVGKRKAQLILEKKNHNI